VKVVNGGMSIGIDHKLVGVDNLALH
jgi:hypothetical protein